MKRPELLAPAGNMEKLRMALIYGADAVYMGGKSFGLRAFSDNFELFELEEGINFTHSLGKKAYITVNIFPHNDDLTELPGYIRAIAGFGADGIIVADPGVFRMVRVNAPNLPIHISTQANSTNWSTVVFWEDLEAHRVVLARELSFADLKLIREKTKIELEVFIHGAMCISYSGRCLLSNYLAARDANRGECAQPCRWKYYLMEETRPNQYYPVLEDEQGTYIFNSKDLCLLKHIPELITAGLNSFKIEGRMKSVHYVATVVKVYREAIDQYMKNPNNFQIKPEWLDELNKISHRDYTTGFFLKETSENTQIYGTSSYKQSHDFIGLVKEYNPATKRAVIEQRNNIKVGETIEIMQPGKPKFIQEIQALFDEDGNPIAVAPHPQQIISMPVAQPVVPYAMLRREVNKKNYNEL
ncbi:MAG TPA: U32 family peptidase [Methylomusa anaerophila]|uniref:Putative protease YhbU n=1 Tax=Methylomusa anaerophila TaxID=1930071 RepID=A0A348APA1_9FIRM|nr:U32 family peptidase [Methylomusa anaerophila]BBB92899.1 putative protease YhbU precursor [Methylomusa anaerophila]HML87265.1 U32 family peptidase [Methylomusa anaerophila]